MESYGETINKDENRKRRADKATGTEPAAGTDGGKGRGRMVVVVVVIYGGGGMGVDTTSAPAPRRHQLQRAEGCTQRGRVYQQDNSNRSTHSNQSRIHRIMAINTAQDRAGTTAEITTVGEDSVQTWQKATGDRASSRRQRWRQRQR
jgi:hypothetical protein